MQPAANVELTVTADARLPTGIQLAGRGYVEKLELTIPPWRLPFNELFWGRFVGNAHSLVWLQWRDTRSARAGRRFAILDGDLHTGTTITSDAVRLSEAGAELHMPQWRSLREGALVETVFGAVPGLTRVLPARFLRIHESKRLSRCELHLPDEAGANGWAIHEVVRW